MRMVMAGALLLFLYLPVRSQQKIPSQAEIQAALKNLKDVRRITDSVMNDPNMKKMIGQGKAGTTGTSGVGGGMRPDTSMSYKLPPKNVKALGGLSPKPLRAPELVNYLSFLDRKLSPVLHTKLGTPLINTDKYDPVTLSNASVLAAGMGMLDQAILLSLKAAERDPADPLVLNNTGAVLQKGGLEVAAIPILEAALEQDPGNSTVTNNLGQSYLSLGDKDRARQYLQQCVSVSINHPLANTSLALIDLDRGDRQAALQHVENSLRGAFTDKGYHLLYQLKKDPILMDYFSHRYKQPEYFNEDKYHLPMQCERVTDIPAKRAEYKAYRDMLEQVKHTFETEAKEEGKTARDEMMQRMKNIRPGNGIYRYQAPFMELANAMLFDAKMRLERGDGDKIARAQQHYKERMAQLSDEYKRKQPDAARQGCGAEIGLANEYMEKMAIETRAYQKVYLPIWKDFYQDNAFWSFFTSNDVHLRKSMFCGLTVSFISVLQQLATTSFLDPGGDCAVEDEQKQEADEIRIKEDCPLGEDGVEIPFVIGKYSISCDKHELEFGEGLVVNLSHNFNSGETILAVGPGVSVSLIGHSHEALLHVPQLKVGPLKGGLEAGIKGQVFLDLKNGALVDWGGTFQAEMDVLGMAREFKTGYTLGMNSGLNMEPGIVKDLIDENLGPPKEAPPLNKNVKTYNPK